MPRMLATPVDRASGPAAWALALCALLAPGTAEGRAIRVAEPKIAAPVAPREPGDSFLHVPVAVPLRFLLDSLERAIPDRLDTGDGFAPVSDTAEVRYAIRREPFRVDARGDTLILTATIRYWLAARGAGFPDVACGSRDEPIEGTIGALTRIGWRDDWRVDSRARPLAIVHESRCKPRPPGINFTEVVTRVVESAMVAPLAPAVDSILARDTGLPRAVEAAWTSVHRPVSLTSRRAWLDFAPRGLVTGPVTAAADRLAAEVAIAVRPAVRTADPPASRPRPTPEPRVRLAGDELWVAFDCESPVEVLAGQVGRRCAAGAGGIRTTGVRLRTGAERLVVAVDVAGDVEGTLYLAGSPAYDAGSYTLAVAGLDFTPETKAALGGPGAPPAERLEALRACVEESLRFDLRASIAATGNDLGRALNADLGGGVSISGGTSRREPFATYATAGALGVRFVASGRAALAVR